MKNSYVFQARIVPAIILLTPLLIEINVLLSIYNIKIEWSLVLSNLLLCAFGLLSASYISQIGKGKEKNLFKSWGGIPTTRFIRLDNSEYNYTNKIKVRNNIERFFQDITLPTLNDEKTNPEKADEIYSIAVCRIREITRDKNKYSLVYQENINYGMWRNLYGIKDILIGILIILYLTNIILVSIQKLAMPYFILLILLDTLILLFIVNVKEKKIKDVAEKYATQLFNTFATL